ncbi:hypothetical protein ACTXGQ_29495, partial [Marinobacter sp. 1Y8]
MNKIASQSQSKDGNPDKEKSTNQSQSQSQSIKVPNDNTKSPASTPIEDTLTKDTLDKPEKKPQSFDELQISKGKYRPVAQAVGHWLDNI